MVVILAHALIGEDVMIYAIVQRLTVNMVNKVTYIKDVLESGGKRPEL